MECKLDKGTMIVSETNEKGVITYVNNDFCKFSSYTKDEVIGKPHNIVRHKDMPKDVFKDLWTSLKSNKPWHGIVKNKSKNGDYYWGMTYIYPSTNSDGQKRYVSIRTKATQNDIEDIKRLYHISE